MGALAMGQGCLYTYSIMVSGCTIAASGGEAAMPQRRLHRRRRSPSALSLDDVRKSGQLAFFHAFGDNLVYLHGTVYSVPSQTESSDPEELIRQPDAYAVTAGAGIEFGWYHREGCECEFCRRSRSSDGEKSKPPSGVSSQDTPAPVS